MRIKVPLAWSFFKQIRFADEGLCFNVINVPYFPRIYPCSLAYLKRLAQLSLFSRGLHIVQDFEKRNFGNEQNYLQISSHCTQKGEGKIRTQRRRYISLLRRRRETDPDKKHRILKSIIHASSGSTTENLQKMSKHRYHNSLLSEKILQL